MRTAQRWERTEHLPVHRPANSKRGSVFAFKAEIDAWWKNRHPILRHIEDRSATPTFGPAVRTSAPAYLRVIVLSGLAIVALLVWGAGTLLRPSHNESSIAATQSQITIAVLPFQNLSTDPNDQALAAVITKGIVNRLSKTVQFRLIPIKESNQSRPNPLPPEQMIQQYHPRILLQGTIARTGDSIRIAAQLIDASTGRNISEDQFERSQQTRSSLESEIPRLISDSVRNSLLPANTVP